MKTMYMLCTKNLFCVYNIHYLTLYFDVCTSKEKYSMNLLVSPIFFGGSKFTIMSVLSTTE